MYMLVAAHALQLVDEVQVVHGVEHSVQEPELRNNLKHM